MDTAQMLQKSICTITDPAAVRHGAWMSPRGNVHLPKVADEGGFMAESTCIRTSLPPAVVQNTHGGGAVWAT